MEPIDDELDEHLCRLARPDPGLAHRVAARALTTTPRHSRLWLHIALAGASGSLLVGVLGWRYWMPVRPPAVHDTAARVEAGVVLIRAPDGSAAIIGEGGPRDEVPPGSGFVISEGEER